MKRLAALGAEIRQDPLLLLRFLGVFVCFSGFLLAWLLFWSWREAVYLLGSVGFPAWWANEWWASIVVLGLAFFLITRSGPKEGELGVGTMLGLIVSGPAWVVLFIVNWNWFIMKTPLEGRWEGTQRSTQSVFDGALVNLVMLNKNQLSPSVVASLRNDQLGAFYWVILRKDGQLIDGSGGWDVDKNDSSRLDLWRLKAEKGVWL